MDVQGVLDVLLAANAALVTVCGAYYGLKVIKRIYLKLAGDWRSPWSL